MKRITILAATLALVLAVAVPAIAQVTQAPTGTFVSGQDTNNVGSVTGGGSSANACAAQENFNNTGGVLNQPVVQQYASKGAKPGGAPSFTNSPKESAPCAPAVQQSGSSSSGQ